MSIFTKPLFNGQTPMYPKGYKPMVFNLEYIERVDSKRAIAWCNELISNGVALKEPNGEPEFGKSSVEIDATGEHHNYALNYYQSRR